MRCSGQANSAESVDPVYVGRYGMDLGPDAHETAIGEGKTIVSGLPLSSKYDSEPNPDGAGRWLDGVSA